MFDGAIVFNQDLSGWNTCKVSRFLFFSFGATAWTRPMPNFNPCIDRATLRTVIANGEDVTGVNTSQITDMSFLFRNNRTFNQDISAWDVGNVTNMEKMFFQRYCL